MRVLAARDLLIKKLHTNESTTAAAARGDVETPICLTASAPLVFLSPQDFS